MKKISQLIIILILSLGSMAQEISPTLPLWKTGLQKTAKGLGNYTQVELESKVISDLYSSKMEKFSINLPGENNDDIIVDFMLKPMNSVKIKLNNSSYTGEINLPQLYCGKVRGLKHQNDVMLTIAPGYISMQAILPNLSISVEKEMGVNSTSFVMYNSKDFQLPQKPFSCGLPAIPVGDSLRKRSNKNNNIQKVATPSDKCLFVYVDCSQDLFFHYDTSVQNTVNNIYSIWNDVRTAFRNEQLNIAISEVNVWTTAVPFNTGTRETGIQTFAAYYRNNYWGNMAMLLDWSATTNSGVAGGYGWAKGIAPNFCGNYNANPVPSWNHGSYIYNDLNYFGNYQNYPVPARAQEVYIFTHEIGHLLGSEHTHSCNWPGGPIDNCTAVEGVCNAGPSPVNGGTFMSYCIGAGQFMNFNKGFGPLPGGVIRDFVDGNVCLTNCVSCAANATIGSIPFQGSYQYEASNLITASGVINGNSATIVKLDAGVKVRLAPGFKATQGGKVKIFIDGCGGIR